MMEEQKFADFSPESPKQCSSGSEPEEVGRNSGTRNSGKRERSQNNAPPEQDKRLRREIANSNERRRMQCINNGFVSLQMILPKMYTKRGEKMSKAAVLQSTVEYISKLEMENSKLQAKNEALLQKLNLHRLDSGGESNDEGISIAEDIERRVSSVKDLVNMVQHWRQKCNRERCLRTQADEDIRRLVLEMQYCPSGCSKREHSILRRSKSPSPEEYTYDRNNFLLPTQDEYHLPASPPVIKVPVQTVVKVDTYSQFPEVPEQQRQRKAPKQQQVQQHRAVVRQRQCPCGQPTCDGNVSKCFPLEAESQDDQPLTGFDLLVKAIKFSEHNWDLCDRSDSGCSEETYDSNEPLKKRRKTTQERVCS